MKKDNLNIAVLSTAEFLSQKIEVDLVIDTVETVMYCGYTGLFITEGKGVAGNFHYGSSGFVHVYGDPNDGRLFFNITYQSLVHAFKNTGKISAILIHAMTKTPTRSTNISAGIMYGLKSAYTDVGKKAIDFYLRVYFVVEEKVVERIKEEVEIWKLEEVAV